jgi:hypothetical protein
MRRCLLRWQDERLFPTFCVFEHLGHGFSLNLRFLIVLTNHDQHRRDRLTSNISPDLQERLLAEAKRCLATAGSTPEPVSEPTRDETNNATPVLWPGPLVVPRPPGAA